MDRRGFLLASASAALVAGADFVVGDSALGSDYWPAPSITRLPYSSHRRMAWTLDDGFSRRAIDAYLTLLEKHEWVRMTMFVVPVASPWKHYRSRITDLVSTGRLQLGNHTYSHANLLKLSDHHIRQELIMCSEFIHDNFGVVARPYYRPPYGYIDKRVIRVAASVGYTKPVLWMGSTSASSTSDVSTVWSMCQKWMTNGRIVIDHANNFSTPTNFGRILPMLQSRGLSLVTISDVFG